MRKYDEGYTVPLVLVVMVILVMVASLVLAGSLQTAKAQQQAIAQMQEKYQAQGQIEMLVAQLLTESEYASMMEITEIATKDHIIALCGSAGVTLVTDDVTNEAGEIIIAKPAYSLEKDALTEKNVLTYCFTVKSQYNDTQITAQLTLVCDIVENEANGNKTVSLPKITYETYQIGGGT